MNDASAFLERFVHPLVAGGQVHVGAPLDLEDFQRLSEGLPHASHESERVDEARADIVRELVVAPRPLLFAEDELALAAAIYNLLFLSHPRTDVWTVLDSFEDKVARTAGHFADQPLTRDRHKALARHSLLHSVFELSRPDTKVSWWLGSATFVGQKPPWRLTSMPTLRRVREETVWAGFADLLGTPETAPVVAKILRRSPLTQLLSRATYAPSIRWEEATFLLRDPGVCRAVAYRAVEGDVPADVLELPSRYADALDQLLERSPREADVRAVCAFLMHLNGLLALWERGRGRGGRGPRLVAELAPERAGKRLRGLSTFLALPMALAEVDPRLADVPGLFDVEGVKEVWERRNKEAAERVGDAVIEALVARLQRRLSV